MADKKISALTGATTPLAGTEVLPIVQGGNTVKVSVDNLTTGKTVTANGLVLTGAATINNSIAIRWKNGSGTARDVIQLYGNDLYVDSEDGDQIYRVGGYEKYRLSSTNATLTNVNLVVGTAGKGIDFSANTHAAGMTSELLNRYEEGVFTPTDVSGAGLTFANAEGRYTRIGRMVFASFSVTFPATADTNYAAISLPYASFAMTRSSFPGAFAYTDYANPVVGFVSGSKCEFYLFGGSALRNSNLSGNNVRLTCIYEAA